MVKKVPEDTNQYRLLSFLHYYTQLDSNILSLKTPQIWSQHMRNQPVTKLEVSTLLKFS